MRATEWAALIVAVLTISVWVICAIRSRRERRERPLENSAENLAGKAPEKPTEKSVEGGASSKLVINLGKPSASGGTASSGAPVRTPPKPQATAKSDIESLDGIYAKNMRKKICPYCETVNSAGADVCCACGNSIEK